jgi:multiple sugar transport system permease protein
MLTRLKDTSDAAPIRTVRSPVAQARGVSLQTLIYVTAGVFLSVLFVGPLVWAVLRSFEPETALVQQPAANVFGRLSVANYTELFSRSVDIGKYVLNSLVVAVGTSAIAGGCAVLAGYGLGRFRFLGRNMVLGLILVTLMIPFQAILTPLFIELNTVHLTNSLLGLMLFYAAFNLPFGVYVMRNTFLQIPSDLEDAAFVDGASHRQILWRVFRPLVLPGLATTVLYSFLFSWTEFLGAITFLTSQSKFTLPVELVNLEFGTYGGVNFGYVIAGAVITMVPCVVLYIGLQRYYVQGLMAGSLKG